MARMAEGWIGGSGRGGSGAVVAGAGNAGQGSQAMPSRRSGAGDEESAPASATSQIACSALSPRVALANRSTKPASITSSRAPLSFSR
jgi:hypothetical protein